MLTRVFGLKYRLRARDMPKPGFYAVARGRSPGVYTDWNTTFSQVKGFPGNKHAKFATREEAEAYIKLYAAPTSSFSTSSSSSSSSSISSSSYGGSYYGPSRSSASSYAQSSSLSRSSTKSSAGYGHEPLVSVSPEDGVPSYPAAQQTYSAEYGGSSSQYHYARIKSSSSWEPQPTSPYGTAPTYYSSSQEATYSSSSNASFPPLHVWTDGACAGNGQIGSKAGVGVYFGPQDPRNVSRPLDGERQTNQRAEMTAAIEAMETTRDEPSELVIHTDSAYVINGMDDWILRWSPKKAAAAENADLWAKLKAAREARAGKTTFVYVKGHSGDPGNDAADQLAVQGAKMNRR